MNFYRVQTPKHVQTPKIPLLSLGSILVPLALDASALTTELPHYIVVCTWNFYFFFIIKNFCQTKFLTDMSAGPTLHIQLVAGLSGSVGCVVRLETRRSRVQPPPRSATFFRGDWSWNIFYGHSLPSADSRRAVVSFWQKNVHNTG